MRELRGGARLAQEALAHQRIGRQRRREDLERDGAVQPLVAGEEDDAHPPATEFALDAVGAGEGGREAREFGVDGRGGHESG